MLESKFQSGLIKEIKERFPGSVVLKTDATYIQGFPDLLILFENHWACLEVKKGKTAKHRPNQDLWIDKLNKMSFASFIWPENKKEVLDAMARSFKGLS